MPVTLVQHDRIRVGRRVPNTNPPLFVVKTEMKIPLSTRLARALGSPEPEAKVWHMTLTRQQLSLFE